MNWGIKCFRFVLMRLIGMLHRLETWATHTGW